MKKGDSGKVKIVTTELTYLGLNSRKTELTLLLIGKGALVENLKTRIGRINQGNVKKAIGNTRIG